VDSLIINLPYSLLQILPDNQRMKRVGGEESVGGGEGHELSTGTGSEQQNLIKGYSTDRAVGLGMSGRR